MSTSPRYTSTSPRYTSTSPRYTSTSPRYTSTALSVSRLTTRTPGSSRAVTCRQSAAGRSATIGQQGRTAGPTLQDRALRCVELLSRYWQAAVPKDSEDAQELLYDVVSAADGAKIHPWSAAA